MIATEPENHHLQKRQTKIQRPVAKCIFCGIRYANSKEDYWPKWLQPHLPVRSPFTAFRTRAGKATSWTVNAKIKGDPTRQKIEVVCRECNSGWMSQIQNEAARLLKPYTQTKFMSVSDQEQQNLATWATVFTMVIEYYDPPTIVATFGERSSVQSTRKPPSDWRIYICRLKDNDYADWWHTGAHLIFDDTGPDRILFNAIWFGSIGFLVVRNSIPVQMFDEALDEDMHTIGFRRLWPTSSPENFFFKRLSFNTYMNCMLSVNEGMYGDLDASL